MKLALFLPPLSLSLSLSLDKVAEHELNYRRVLGQVNDSISVRITLIYVQYEYEINIKYENVEALIKRLLLFPLFYLSRLLFLSLLWSKGSTCLAYAK